MQPEGAALQRLFSTFADGWPGGGLLLQRLLTGTVLLYCGITHLVKASQFVPITPHLIGAGAGILLLVGLWTPAGGLLATIVELRVVLSRDGDPLIPLMLATLSGSLAMIGPGAWSVDARLFGRKHIELGRGIHITSQSRVVDERRTAIRNRT
jgi:putative oxidoreductase